MLIHNTHTPGTVVIVWQLNLQPPMYMQSVLITTVVVSLNPARGEMFSIQHCVIKFVSDLRQVYGTMVSFTNKTDPHDVTEILLKVALNTITLTRAHQILLLITFINNKSMGSPSYFTLDRRTLIYIIVYENFFLYNLIPRQEQEYYESSSIQLCLIMCFSIVVK